MTFPYTCCIEPLFFHSLCNSEQMGRQVIVCSHCWIQPRVALLPWVGAHQWRRDLPKPSTARDFAASGRLIRALNKVGSDTKPGRMDLNQHPGEAALSIPHGSRVWGDTAWEAGARSGRTVAIPALPLLLTEAAGGNLKKSPT